MTPSRHEAPAQESTTGNNLPFEHLTAGGSLLRQDQKYQFASQEESASAFQLNVDLLRLAVDASTDGIWDYDLTTGKTYYSPAYFHILGLEPADELTNSATWLDLIHPEDRQRAWETNQRCIEGPKDAFQVEFRMRSKDGNWRWILSHGKCVGRDAAGRALRLVGTHTDISQHKLAEASLAAYEALLQSRETMLHEREAQLLTQAETLRLQEETLRTQEKTLRDQEEILTLQAASLRDKETSLLESETKYRTLFHTSTDALFLETLEGQVVDCNQTACSMFGYTRDELLNTPATALMPPDVEETMISLDGSILSGEVVKVKEYNLRKNGEVFPAEINLQLVSISGEPRVMVAVRDITTLEHSEKVQASLFHISEAVQTTADLDQLYKVIHSTISGLMKADNFYIAIYDERANLLSFPYSIDEYDPTPLPHKPGRGLTEYVLRSGQPTLVTAEIYDRLLRSGEIEGIGTPPVDWLGVPLKTQEQTIGIMVLQSYNPQMRYTLADRDMLVFISNQAASAIQRKRAGEQIQQLNRTLQSISQVNQVLVRAADEDELMQHVCQVLAGTRDYPLAWIGLLEHDEAQTVRPAVIAGDDRGYIRAGQLSWASQGDTGSLNTSNLTSSAAALTRAAIRSGRPALRQYLSESPPAAMAAEAAAGEAVITTAGPAATCGYASAISLPLISGKQPLGAVHVYAAEPNAFNEEAVALLTQMADDLAFGITALRERDQRQQAILALSENEEKYRSVVERANDGITILQNRYVRFTNQRLAEMLGMTVEEVTGKSFLDYVARESRASILEYTRRRFKGEVDSFTYTTNLLHKDGHTIATEINSSLLTFQGALCELVIVRDITERKQVEIERAQRLAELEAVNRISSALRTARTLDEMLQILLDETLAVMNTTVGSIWLYDAPSAELRQIVSRGWFSNIHKPQKDISAGIGGLVYSTGQVYFCKDFATDPFTREEVRDLIPDSWGGACIPIYTTTERVGILYLGVHSERTLTLTEVHLLLNLAEIAGNAIHRMRLHAQSQLHVQRLNALRIFDVAITSSLDMRLTLDVLLEQAIGQLGVDAADVLLFNEPSGQLEYAAGRGFRSSAVQRSRVSLGEGLAGQVALEQRILTISDLSQAAGSRAQPWMEATEKFKSYIGTPLIAKGNLEGVLELFHREPLNPDAEWRQFLDDLARQAAIAIDNGQLFERLQRSNTELVLAYDIFIEGLSRTLEQRHLETHNHCRRVTDLTLDLSHEMDEFNGEELVFLRRGAILHDIGKLSVPDEILLKKGKLTDEEWIIMRQHPNYAHEMLVPMNFLGPALDIPYCHHEKWDGSGYPRGLKGEQIPLAARIFAVIDVWDALTNDRVYSTAWEPQKVRDHIAGQSGIHFDPRVVEAFIQFYDSGKLLAIVKKTARQTLPMPPARG